MSELCKEIWENGIHYALIGDYYFLSGVRRTAAPSAGGLTCIWRT